jgi:hypothetical protein
VRSNLNTTHSKQVAFKRPLLAAGLKSDVFVATGNAILIQRFTHRNRIVGQAALTHQIARIATLPQAGIPGKGTAATQSKYEESDFWCNFFHDVIIQKKIKIDAKLKTGLRRQ